jgi:uncharacterized iron-regulated membrane protein
MTELKKRNSYLHRLRHFHRILAPIMVLPLLLTVVTGSLYQMVDLAGQGASFDWLLDWHKGHFGMLNLEIIYPFLNTLGLLGLALTGILLWLKTRRNLKDRST